MLLGLKVGFMLKLVVVSPQYFGGQRHLHFPAFSRSIVGGFKDSKTLRTFEESKRCFCIKFLKNKMSS